MCTNKSLSNFVNLIINMKKFKAFISVVKPRVFPRSSNNTIISFRLAISKGFVVPCFYDFHYVVFNFHFSLRSIFLYLFGVNFCFANCFAMRIEFLEKYESFLLCVRLLVLRQTLKHLRYFLSL